MNNFVYLKGRAGNDIEIKYTGSGTALGTFSLAVSKKVQDAWVSQWFRVVTWAATAERLQHSLKKGSDVAVSGELQSRQFETKDGQKREVVEIVGWSVTVSPKVESQQPAVETYDPNADAPPF